MYRFTSILCSLLLVIAISTFFVSCASHSGQGDIPALIERKNNLSSKDETDNIKTTYNNAVAALKLNPDEYKQYINLATAFILEGRLSGNGSYYSNAAGKMLDKVLNSDKADKDLKFQAYSLKSTVLLNMHQFADALDAAKKAMAISDYNAGVYGAMVDANVELGHYEEAVKNCDKMLSIRPDLRSYSRASYLRQIFGDNRGAIDAMKMAVDAGIPGAENTEWARVTLGDLYLNVGNTDSASIVYRSSLVYRPNYPYAEFGLAKLCRAQKRYDEAIGHTKNAINTLSEGVFVSFLADLYELKGDQAKAAEVRNDVLSLMEQGQKDEKDNVIKHNVNREMAAAYLNDNKLDKALNYAKKDLDMRPDNIDANESYAWIMFLKGDYATAKQHADKMLKTNTKNANTLYKAGVIYASAGDVVKADSLKQQALAINPNIDQRIINQSGKFLASN